jgi:hypothetical protein
MAPNKVFVSNASVEPTAVERLRKEMDIPCKRHGVYINLTTFVGLLESLRPESVVSSSRKINGSYSSVFPTDALVQQARNKAVQRIS